VNPDTSEQWDGATVAQAHDSNWRWSDDATVEANAKLIAAAPSLLDACETALANLQNAYASDHLVIKSLRAAIKAAVGE
jgi:hypothetical protein